MEEGRALSRHFHLWHHAAHGDGRTLGERVADGVAKQLGSWRFVILQTIVVLVWMAYNGYVAVHWLQTRAFDPYPWILLNLAFSTQAAYTGPILQMTGNRSAARDRQLAELMFDLMTKNTDLTEEIHQLTRIVHDHVTQEAQDQLDG